MNLSYSILTHDAEEWIFAFYGYGQQAEVFLPLAEKIKAKYNLLVVDLPYQNDLPVIEKKQFEFFINELIKKYQVKKITGISYSMGSRFNLVMAECLPEKIEKLILVAPDGIHLRWWNKIATNTSLGHFLFSYFVKSEDVYLNLLSLLYNVKLIPKSMYAFSKWHMRDTECRTKVYHAWMNMKQLIPDLDTLNKVKTEHNFDIIAYFGKEDTIINGTCVKKLATKIPSANIVLLNKGHNLLDIELFNDIIQHL